MATGIYTRVFDTIVSGNSLLSSLSGNDVRALDFVGAVNNARPLVLTADTEIDVDQLVQSALPNGQLVGTNDAASHAVLIGTDSHSQAAAYVSLFNLRSTNDRRVINFTFRGTTAGVDLVAGNDVTLANSDGTTNFVVVQAAGVAGASAVLFQSTKIAPAVGSGTVGFMREVIVSATTLTSGSEAVVFNVGDGSNV